jgi:hypothetical protein
MNNQVLDIVGFLKLVLEALEATGVEYLIGGAIAEWAWGEPRTASAQEAPFSTFHALVSYEPGR